MSPQTVIEKVTNDSFDITAGDTLPKLVHGSGVNGTNYRWLSRDIPGVDGDVLAAGGWANAVGSILAPMTHGSSGSRPLVKVESGLKMLRFDGTNDEIYPNGTVSATDYATNPFALASPITEPRTPQRRTIAITMRMRTADGTVRGIANFLGGAGQLDAAGKINAFYVGASPDGGSPSTAVPATNAGSPTNAFAVLFFAIDTVDAIPKMKVAQNTNTVETVMAGSLYSGSSTSSRGMNGLTLGRGGPSSWGNIDVLEVNAWLTKYLTAPEIAAHYAAMKAAYSVVA